MPGPSQFALQGTVISTGSLIAPGGQAGLQGNTGAMGDGLPVGAVYAFTSVTPPAGSMLCDGSGISRTLYPALFNLFGTQFGVGDGSTTFNLPDLRSRFILGQGQGSGLTNRVIATTGGEEAHVLTVAELANHGHGLNWSDPGHGHSGGDYGHTHGFNADQWSGTTNAWGSLAGSARQVVGYTTASGNASIYINGSGTGISASVQANGSGSGHNTMPPYVVLVYMIKVAAGSGPSNQAPLADTTQNGLLRQLSGATTDYVGGDNTCHPVPQAGASAGFISKSAAYTLLSGDSGKYILCTGTGWTLTLPIAAPTLSYYVRNDQGLVANGTITIAPQAGKLIDGVSSINILPGQECTILSDGTNWRSFGLQRKLVLGTQDLSGYAHGIVLLPVGYRLFELEWAGLMAPSTSDYLFGQFSVNGGSSWLNSGYYHGGLQCVAGTANAWDSENSSTMYIAPYQIGGTYGHAVLRLDPGSASRTINWIFHAEGRNNSSQMMTWAGGGLLTTAGPVNGLWYAGGNGYTLTSNLTVTGIV